LEIEMLVLKAYMCIYQLSNSHETALFFYIFHAAARSFVVAFHYIVPSSGANYKKIKETWKGKDLNHNP